jgi:putative ABC transport system permease protein
MQNKDTLKNAIALAWDSILAHKLRSFLTLLGVIIGVASVILVGAAIDGLGIYAEQSVSKAFGSESYLIAQIASAGNMSRREYFDRLKTNKPINLPEVNYLRAMNGDRTLYSPDQNKNGVDIKHDNNTADTSTVHGCSSSLADIKDFNIVDGRFFTESEERTQSTVAVIGDETRSILFPDDSSPVGKIVKINGVDFTVVGVQEKLGSAFGQSQDRTAYIPITTYNRLYGTGSQGFAVFARPKPESGLTMEQSLDETRVALRNRFHAQPGKGDRFDSITPDAIRGFIDNILSLVAVVVIPVTSISLVVGGIVIMNIMLVSVTERTREIGIRKALGATQRDLMLQVLSESVLMSMTGGALGVLLGAALTLILGKAFDLTLRITVPYVAISIFVSSAVGIISGWYPASRAAKLDPIAALRSE